MSETPLALSGQDKQFMADNAKRRKQLSRWFYWLCVAIAFLSVIILVVV